MDTQPWLDWAVELQSLAQAGLYYSDNKYELERYERIREIAGEMMAYKTPISKEKLIGLFANEVGYQTPKLDSRAAIIKDHKILLVQEEDGTWALPGGWVDVDQTVHDNLIKEAKEEAGEEITVDRVIALHDRNKRNAGTYALEITKVFALCTSHGGEFKPNNETLQAKYFALDELPEMANHKTTADQVRMCFEAYDDPNWEVVLD